MDDLSVDAIFDEYVSEAAEEPKADALELEEKEETTEQEGGEENEGQEEQDDSSQDGETESASEEGSSEKENEVLEEEDEEIAALKKEIRAESPPSKKIKAKRGNEEIEIEEDLVIPTKVDGQIEEVSLKDLRASYSSKTHNHREYRKLENEKRAFVQAREQFDGVIKNFAQKAKQGAVVPAVMDLIAATGEDPIPIINYIREGLIENAAELFQMTKEQRNALYRGEAADYYAQQTARLREQQVAQTQKQVLEQQITQVISEYGIPDKETFLDTVPKANQYLQEAKAKGQVGQDVTLTPEMVAKFYQASRLQETFRGVMREVAPTIGEDSVEYQRFANWVATNKPNRERILEVAKKIFSSNGSATPSATEKPKEKAKPRKERASVVSKEDDDSVDLSEFGWAHLR
jgi:hypothetical protein